MDLHSTQMPTDRIMLRLYAEVSDGPEVDQVASNVTAKLAAVGTILRSDTPTRYWKIPAHFGFFFVLLPNSPLRAAFQHILEDFGTGWDVHASGIGADWAIWNPSANAVFHVPCVRWAHLECESQYESTPNEIG